MSRTVSLTFREAIFAQETGEQPLVLITLSHPSFTIPLRLCTSPVERFSVVPLRYGVTSRGNQYTFVPMSLVLPDDSGDKAPTARLVTDNDDREIVKVIRSLSTVPTGTLEVVLASSPDLVEAQFPDFDVKDIHYDAETVSLEFSMTSLEDEPYPAHTFNPAYFPGLF